MTQKILSLTGIRVDLGKPKRLIPSVDAAEPFKVAIFITGMNMPSSYNYTLNNICRTPTEHRLCDCMHNILIAYIQGDKVSYIHFVANEKALRRLLRLWAAL